MEDVRHVVEQVALARNILVGDEDGIGAGVGVIRHDAAGAAGGDRSMNGMNALTDKGGVRGASSSVTSLATLSNLVAF